MPPHNFSLVYREFLRLEHFHFQFKHLHGTVEILNSMDWGGLRSHDWKMFGSYAVIPGYSYIIKLWLENFCKSNRFLAIKKYFFKKITLNLECYVLQWKCVFLNSHRPPLALLKLPKKSSLSPVESQLDAADCVCIVYVLTCMLPVQDPSPVWTIVVKPRYWHYIISLQTFIALLPPSWHWHTYITDTQINTRLYSLTAECWVTLYELLNSSDSPWVSFIIHLLELLSDLYFVFSVCSFIKCCHVCLWRHCTFFSMEGSIQVKWLSWFEIWILPIFCVKKYKLDYKNAAAIVHIFQFFKRRCVYGNSV